MARSSGADRITLSPVGTSGPAGSGSNSTPRFGQPLARERAEHVVADPGEQAGAQAEPRAAARR